MSEPTALLKLQDIDLKLLRHAQTLSEMPQQRRIKALAAARKKVSGELTQIVGQRKDIEIDIEDIETNLGEYKDKVAEVQRTSAETYTHRDVRSLEAQLTSLAKRIEKCEFKLGPLLESLERAERAEANARRAIERLDAERAATENSLADDSVNLRQEITHLRRERERVVAEVSPVHLADYERARVRFKGLAVERLQGDVPSICRVKLQTGVFQDLVRKGEISECPYCHRMIVTSGWSDVG